MSEKITLPPLNSKVLLGIGKPGDVLADRAHLRICALQEKVIRDRGFQPSVMAERGEQRLSNVERVTRVFPTIKEVTEWRRRSGFLTDIEKILDRSERVTDSTSHDQ